MGRAGFVLVVSIVAFGFIGASVPAIAQPVRTWSRPVPGRIVRPFDPPKSRFGAGHLGADLAAAPGSPVHAAGPGEVAFAGRVAGSLHVVLAHAGNLRTSYSFLASVAVRRGDRVEGGEVVGTSGGVGPGHDGSVVHFGLRSGDTYLDPMLLLQPVDLATLVHLAPTTIGPRPASGPDERRGLLAGLGHDAGAVAHALGTGLSATGRAAGSALTAAGSGLERFVASRFPLQAAVARGVGTWLGQRGHCNPHAPDADGTGGSDHRVMVVAGIDSSMTGGARTVRIPTRVLGYEAGEVTYFSYAPHGGDYTPADTEVPILTSARRLGAQLRALEKQEPGREVDLLAHSQGGVVVEAFLELVYRPDDPSYPPLGTAVGLSSPFFGDPAATAAEHVRATPLGGVAVDGAEGALRRVGVGLPSSRAQSVRDLADDSPLMHRIKASHLPELVQLTAIGAATDFVVPATASSRPGAQSTVVFPHSLDAHTKITTDRSALRAVRAAIEHRPLPCRSLVSTVASEVVSTAISVGERAVG